MLQWLSHVLLRPFLYAMGPICASRVIPHYLLYRFLFAADVASDTVQCDWVEVHHDPEFSGYSIMAISQFQQLLALGNLHGYIKLLKLDESGKEHHCQISMSCLT